MPEVVDHLVKFKVICMKLSGLGYGKWSVLKSVLCVVNESWVYLLNHGTDL